VWHCKAPPSFSILIEIYILLVYTSATEGMAQASSASCLDPLSIRTGEKNLFKIIRYASYTQKGPSLGCTGPKIKLARQQRLDPQAIFARQWKNELLQKL